MAFSIFTLFTVVAKAQYLWQVFPDTILEWRYQDGDEFSWGIDKTKWHLGFPWGDKIFTQRTYVSPDNIIEKNGVLTISLNKSDTVIQLQAYEIDTAAFRKNKLSLVDSSKFRFLYSGGLLWSKKNYHYGYYELKFKGVSGREIWPAFWLYGGNPNYEIDFFELKGEQPNDIHVDVHCPDGCRNYRKNIFGQRISYGHWVKLNTKLKDNYNVLAGEWTEKYVKWYLNGVLIAHANTNITMPMGLSIGTGINGTEKGYQKKNAADFPNIFEVDYLRVYRCDTLVNTKYLGAHLPQKSTDPPSNLNDFKGKKTNSKLINSAPHKTSENILTISVQQISKEQLQLRVLGAKEVDKLNFMFNDDPALTHTIEGNGEKTIPLPALNTAKLTINVKNKLITKQLRFD